MRCGVPALFAWSSLLLALFLLPFPAGAAKPLTLDEALKAAEAPHPDLELARADLELAAADYQAAGSRRDLSVTLEGGLRRILPALRTPDSDYISDNSIRLNARKNLYDFGRTGSAEDAARSVIEAREQHLIDARDRRRIDIMQRFFDVLVADLQYTMDNEYMAVAYVHFDQMRDHYGQNLISKVDLAEQEARFQEWLVKRNLSEKRQRLTRALLASTMNQPQDLPSELADPALPGNSRKIPDYEALLPLMLDNNPRLKAQQRLLEASRQRMESLRADKMPTLDAELEAADYSQRRLAGRDEQRAGLILTWPIYQGGRVSAQLAREQAQFHRQQAEAERLKRELSQALLAAWMDVEQLQKTVRNAARVEADFRDLRLERARAQYDVELKTNLGDSMAGTMEARLKQRNAEYQLALALAKLEALLGKPLPEQPARK